MLDELKPRDFRPWKPAGLPSALFVFTSGSLPLEDGQMRRFSILTASVTTMLVTPASGVTTFYSLDRSSNPSPNLVSFLSDPTDPTVNSVETLASVGSVHTTVMDVSADGRLFIAPYGTTVYEIDRGTGAILGSLDVGGPIEGLAVSDIGLIYTSVGDTTRIYESDFDAQTVRLLLSTATDIDDLDFDKDGNLIGTDINQSGQVWRIPLDGSPLQLIATLPPVGVGPMTYSLQQDAFYFIDNNFDPPRRNLLRLPWANGQPGIIEHVKELAPGEYVGLAAVPEPSTTVIIETVPVGNPGNVGELSGAGAGGYGEDRICGAVSYGYRIGKYEVTAGQYCAFL
ncbi:MAG: hypothetical protein QUV05_00485, partial [Phycisphaerae bacterium]|nr:hypothetical protein [Phycisphaerae bacterium]